MSFVWKEKIKMWFKKKEKSQWPGLINHYRDLLPVSLNTPVVTLNEGNTPLIHAQKLSEQIGNGNLDIYLKVEGLNPTGSFKDRGMTMAISKGMEEGAKAVICASTGNTSAAAAAYAARAGIPCYVLLPKGGIAMGKLAQALIHGAKVIAVKGTFDQALDLVKQAAEKLPLLLVNSINPYRLQGQKTAAFEICDVLGEAPDFHLIPVGNAGNITAYWMGYKEYFSLSKTKKLPKMFGFQAAGAAPIVEKKVVENPETIATAIKIGNPANWKAAEEAVSESWGQITAVTDEEILEAYRLLASVEGVFCEPASAASVAGLIQAVNAGLIGAKKETVVCTLTGHGLKDPDRAIQSVEAPVEVEPNIDEVLKLISN